MSSEFAKLRTDLVTSRQATADGQTLITKDPSTGRFFRFKEIEGFVLEHLDGATSTESLRNLVQEKYDAQLPLEQLESFIGRLRRLELLDTGTTARLQERTRVGGNPLYLRVKLFDPDRLFDRMTTTLRFFFTPTFVIISAVLIISALFMTVGSWTEIHRDIVALFRFESLVIAWIIVFGVITLHEFAHGLTCKRFGGHVHEIGFLLIYFQPAFYCNVSDAWLFPEKSRRLWVTFAGAYFEIFLWALATLIWRITDTHTSISHAVLIVMATSGFKSLFNLNPLIKFDGYYLLSDYLDIPNLRRNSFAYLGGRIRNILGLPVQRVQAASKREMRIYLIYSLLAGIYSYWLFGLILSYFGNYLTQRYQGWGLILFFSFLIVIFRNPILKLFRMNKAEPVNDVQTQRFGRRLKVSAVLIIILAFLIFYKTDLKVSGEFVILPVHNADVRAEVSGIIESVYHDEGETVEQGTMIAQLSDRETRAELDKVKAQFDEKSAKLKLLKAGARQEELTLARTQVEKAEERLKYARKDLEMDRALLKNNVISTRQFDQSEGNVAVREKELQEARNQLNILLAGNRREEIDAIQAEVGSLQAQEKYLNEQLRELQIISPIQGIIATRKLREKIGQNVNKGDLIAEVHQLNSVEAEIAVPEKELADVATGQKVVLKARAFPQESFEGNVVAIAPMVSKQENTINERTILVITKLENPSLLLKPEMSGNAKIYCGERRLIEIATRRFVRFFRVEFWSWW